MVLSRIADEIELLSQADRWLGRSLSEPCGWSHAFDGQRHGEDVRRFQSASMGARFPGGEVQSEALALSLAFELRRLCEAPRMLRFALERGSWPDDMKLAGRIILSGIEGLAGH